jgi:hypothetical protein
VRAIVEGPVRAQIERRGREEVVIPPRILRLIGLLGVVATLAQVSVEQARPQLLRHDRSGRRSLDVDLASRMPARPHDGIGRQLRLIDRRDRLGSPQHMAARPLELRGVQRRELDHRHAHVRPIVQELATDRIREASKPVLRSAVGRLQNVRAVALPTPDEAPVTTTTTGRPAIVTFPQVPGMDRPYSGPLRGKDWRGSVSGVE